MADFVRITKYGIREYDWNSKTRDYDCSVPTDNVHHLRTRCEIEEGVTLGDIFRAVEADPALKAVIAAYSWCWEIDAFHEQAKLPAPAPKEDEKPEDVLTHLEVTMNPEVHKPRRKEKGHFDTGTNFGGVSTGCPNWGVSYTPMNELQHLPVKLVTDCEIRQDYTEVLWKGECCFSLLEVLDAIYWDISFMGGPEDNKAFIEKLDGMIDEINADPSRLVPLDLDALEKEIEAEEAADQA